MPLVTPTPITALDGLLPPSSSDPVNFDARGDAFLGAFPTLQTQINTVGTQAHTNASFAQEQASSAVAQVSSAAAQVSLATTQAVNAANSATAAELSATSAATAGNAPKWTSGTSFSEGSCCWSPVDYQTYRKITAGTSTTGEPTITSSTWRLLAPVNHLANLALGVI